MSSHIRGKGPTRLQSGQAKDRNQDQVKGQAKGQAKKFTFNATIGSLLFVPFMMVLGNSMLIPVIPAMRQAMALSEAQTGLIITAFSIPAALFIPVAGFLADRFGRKTVIVPSLILYGIGGAIAVAAAIFLQGGAYGLLMAGRVVQGLGAAGTANIALALVGDLYAGSARGEALGLMEAANGFGKVASPILGAALGIITWFAPFVFFTILTVPVALAVAWLARERKPQSKASIGQYFGSIVGVFRKKGVPLVATLISGMVVLFLLFGVLFYLSEILESQFGLQGVVKGLVLALPVLATSVTAYISGTYLQKLGRRLLVSAGLGIMTLVLLTLALVQNPFFLYAAIVFIGIGSGLALATLNVLVTSSVDLAQRGMITSDYGAVRFLGVALGPPLFGLLMGSGNLVLFGAATALGLATLAAAFFLIDEKKLIAE